MERCATRLPGYRAVGDNHIATTLSRLPRSVRTVWQRSVPHCRVALTWRTVVYAALPEGMARVRAKQVNSSASAAHHAVYEGALHDAILH
jgi:hypothetical protein